MQNSVAASSAKWCHLRSASQFLLSVDPSAAAERQEELVDALHAHNAVISGFLPTNSWLVVAEADRLQTAVQGLGWVELVRRLAICL